MFDPRGGLGYHACARLKGPDFERVFYEANMAAGAIAYASWKNTNHTTSNNWSWNHKLPILDADSYGFHYSSSEMSARRFA